MITSVSDTRHKHALIRNQGDPRDSVSSELWQRQIVILHDSDLDPTVAEGIVDSIVPLGPGYWISPFVHQGKRQVPFLVVSGNVREVVEALLHSFFCHLVFLSVGKYHVIGPTMAPIPEPGCHDNFTNILPLGEEEV